MRKPHLIALIAILALIASFTYAEQITFSTYYPAPYGVYNNFEVKGRSVVGDISSSASGVTDVEDLDRGELWVQDSMILEPKASFNPDTEPAGKEGELVYSSSDDALYHYNGSDWVASGGGSGIKSVQRGTAQFMVAAGTGTYGYPANIKIQNITLTEPIIDLTKTKLKVWLASDMGINSVSYAPVLTSATNLRIYIGCVSTTPFICQATYEITEHE